MSFSLQCQDDGEFRHFVDLLPIVFFYFKYPDWPIQISLDGAKISEPRHRPASFMNYDDFAALYESTQINIDNSASL